MSEKNAAAPTGTPVSPNGKPAAPAAVIRRLEAAEETAQERLIKKHVPAWVVSGAVHVAVIALMILILPPRTAETKSSEKVITTTAVKEEDVPEEENLLNEDLGLDSRIEAALPEIERQDEQTIEAAVTADPVGMPDTPTTDLTAYAPTTGLIDPSTTGNIGEAGDLRQGLGGANARVNTSYNGRSGSTKSKLVAEGGGNSESERAVAIGLAWLARQQKKDGGWVFDKGEVKYRATATAMALLPFLAAGQTHKPAKGSSNGEKDYSKTVAAGLDFLKKMCGPNQGRFMHEPGKVNMYEQGIATLALCEAYGMTKDPTLRPYAQSAINFVQKAQGPNGSWGYGPGADGDTSIVGWQIQALQAAKLSKDLVVDDRIIKKAVKFLDYAAAGSRKSMYGYNDSGGARPGTALTAVGLLSRYYIDGWGPSHPGMIDGVGGLVKNPPVGRGQVKNMYYYYYATQVVHFYEGEDWKNWNEGKRGADGKRTGGMRDWLVAAQVRKANDPNNGSWDPEGGTFGTNCGRLGTTAICLLTLEVYYRHLPLYKRSANGDIQILEDK